MDLGGRWRAVPATEELRRILPDPGYDDGAWEVVPVPGQWRDQPAFAGEDGPVLYRRRFGLQRPEPGRRAWLTLEGLFYQADVWLDGSYLGDTEGYFAPQTFEVTDHAAERDEHLLAVELSCAPQTDLRHKRNLTGVFQHWDAIDPSWNPGGIWAPVRIGTTGPVRLASLRVLCREASAERATLEIEARLDADETRTVTVTTWIRPHAAGGSSVGGTPADAVGELVEDHELAAGANRVRWRLTVERPALWWPHALGDRPLHDLGVDIAVGDESSDGRVVRTGLRQIRMRNFIARVNGERLFLKGANLGPTRRALAEATPDEVRADLDLARRAGLDLLRVHAHIARPELYEEADRIGMLLWQDLPLQWDYGPVRKEAVRQARQAVDLLGHHPAIAMWCGHDEPGRAGTVPGEGGAERRGVRAALSQTLPNWNRTALDRSIRRALERADGSRPVVSHAGVAPHPTGGTDTHLGFGWEHGGTRELDRTLARWPVLARFVGSFGPAAVPTTASFMGPERWPDLDWDRLQATHGLDRVTLERRVPVAGHASFGSWSDATQRYQADVVRAYVETLRRLKYRPTGGFCQALLADAQPAISRALLDHERRAKPALAALTAACAPVIVVADRPDGSYAPGDRVDLDVHAVSDLRRDLSDIEATAHLSWPGGTREWRWSGEVPADSCVRIGRVRLTLPEDAGVGPLHLRLSMRWLSDPASDPGAVSSVTNAYESRVSTGLTRETGRTLPATDGKGST